MKEDKKPTLGDIFSQMKIKPTQEDERLIENAFHFAEKAHEGQTRKSGVPYFYHCIEVAKNLAEFGLDATTIAAGLLHDVVEDTPITSEELQKIFSTEVEHLVAGVTKIGQVKYKGEERYLENWRKFVFTMADDVRIIMIKLADRLHNAQTLQHLRPDKSKRIALETIEIHANIADRLGMWKIKKDLEDASFPFAYPKENEKIKKLLKQYAKNAEKDLDQVYKNLRVELVKNKIEVINSSYRVKGIYSLYRKLLKKDMHIEKVYDIVALRVIVPTIETCYQTLGVIHSRWKPFPGRIKDYIALRKPNGYQSLHTTIFTGNGGIAEIQIRTPEMHEHAEYGIAAHLAYKSKNKKEEKEYLQWLQDMQDFNKKHSTSPKDFFDALKSDFFKKRIFVFTPQGDVIDLPEESSAIDFAFAIHTDIGKHLNSVEINGKHSSIYTKLNNGDIVKAVSAKNSNPSSKWIDYAKTSLAKKQINKYLDENSLVNKFINRFRN